MWDQVTEHHAAKTPFVSEFVEVDDGLLAANRLILPGNNKADIADAVVLPVTESISLEQITREDVVLVLAVGASRVLNWYPVSVFEVARLTNRK
jgi:hypothetical protein